MKRKLKHDVTFLKKKSPNVLDQKSQRNIRSNLLKYVQKWSKNVMGEKRKKWMSKKDFEEMAKRDRSNNVMARQAGQCQLALGRRRRKSSWV